MPIDVHVIEADRTIGTRNRGNRTATGMALAPMEGRDDIEWHRIVVGPAHETLPELLATLR